MSNKNGYEIIVGIPSYMEADNIAFVAQKVDRGLSKYFPRYKSIIVNGYSDHVHVFFGRNPSISTSETVSAIKKSSAFFINEQKWFPGKFQWQDGYGAFSYSRSQVNDVYNYIAKQEDHHKSRRFRDEYIEMLNKAEIDFDMRFLFNFIDDPI